MNDFQKLRETIESNNTFLITTHVNPDADAIGSELAFYSILKKLKKKVRIVNHSSTPGFLTFLDPQNILEKYSKQTHAELFKESDVLIALDFNQANRMVSMEENFQVSSKIKICIDHHENPENFADQYFNCTDYSSTGEIIYDFIKRTSIVKLDFEIAQSLYAAIMTDTGSFRFDRTTSKTHRIIAEFLDLGVDPFYVYDKIYDQGEIGRIKLLGEALNSITLNKDKNVCYMIVTQQALKRSGAFEEDVDGFVNYCLKISNVKIGILFYELKNGIKISFRSKGNIPVNKLASEFNGGGHINAAGARLYNETLKKYISKVIGAAEKYLQ